MMRKVKFRPVYPETESLHTVVDQIVFDTQNARENITNLRHKILASLVVPSAERRKEDVSVVLLHVLYLYLCNEWNVQSNYPRQVAGLCRELLSCSMLMKRRIGCLGFGLLYHELRSEDCVSIHDLLGPIRHVFDEGNPQFISVFLTLLLDSDEISLIADEIFPDVSELANPVTGAFVWIRTKALRVMAKMVTVNSTIAPFSIWANRMTKTLQLEKHPSILLGIVRLIESIVRHNRGNTTPEHILLMESLVRLLSIGLNEPVPLMYHFGGVPTPWLMLAIIKCIAGFPASTLVTTSNTLVPLMLQLIGGLGSYVTDLSSSKNEDKQRDEIRTSFAIGLVDIVLKVANEQTFTDLKTRLIGTLVALISKQKRYSTIISYSSMRCLVRMIETVSYDEIDDLHLNLISVGKDPLLLYQYHSLIASTSDKSNYKDGQALMIECIRTLSDTIAVRPEPSNHSNDPPEMPEISCERLTRSDSVELLKRMIDTIAVIVLRCAPSILSVLELFFTIFDHTLPASLPPEVVFYVGRDFQTFLIRVIIGYRLSAVSVGSGTSDTVDETIGSSSITLQRVVLNNAVERLTGVGHERIGQMNAISKQFSAFVLGELSTSPGNGQGFQPHQGISLLSKVLSAECDLCDLDSSLSNAQTFRMVLLAIVKIVLHTKAGQFSNTKNTDMIQAISTICMQKAMKYQPHIVAELSILLSEGTANDLPRHPLFPRDLVPTSTSLNDHSKKLSSKTLIDLYKIRNQSSHAANSNGEDEFENLTIGNNQHVAGFTENIPDTDDDAKSPSILPPPVEIDSQNNDGINTLWPWKTNSVMRVGLFRRGFLHNSDHLTVSVISMSNAGNNMMRLMLSVRVPDKDSDEDETLIVRLKGVTTTLSPSNRSMLEIVTNPSFSRGSISSSEYTTVTITASLQQPFLLIPAYMVIRYQCGMSDTDRVMTCPLPFHYHALFTPSPTSFSLVTTDEGTVFDTLWKRLKAKRSSNVKVVVHSDHLKNIWQCVGGAMELLRDIVALMNMAIGSRDKIPDTKGAEIRGASALPGHLQHVVLARACMNQDRGAIKISFRCEVEGPAPIFARLLEGLCTYGPRFELS